MSIPDLLARLDGPGPRAALRLLDARRAELEAACATDDVALEALSRRAIARGEAAAFVELCERDLLRRRGDDPLLLVEYVQALRFAGRGETAAPVIRRHLPELGAAPALLRARLLREAVFLELAEGDLAEAVALAERAVGEAASLGERGLAVHVRCLLALGLVERYRGRIAEALDIAYRALALPGIDASTDVLVETLGYTIIGHLDRGQEDAARRLLERARALRSRAPESQWIMPAVAEASLAHVEGRFDEAARGYERAVAACERFCFREIELRVLACLVVLELERDRAEPAAKHVERMTERVETSGLVLLSFAAKLLHLAVEATRGRDVGRELAEVAQIEELLPRTGLVARVFDALVLLVEARAARAGDEVAAIARRHARIGSRSEEGERWLDQSADLRGLLRAAARPLAALGIVTPREERPARLVVEARGTWFQVGDGPRFRIEDRPMFRGILLLLAEERIAHPGKTVARERLFAAGWPGDRSANASMTIRLRVAMSNLRKLGLGGAARASRGGFLLDPGLDVALA